MKGKWRQNLHIEPPCGWMNDPNGLCFYDGLYHVYFQYSPDTPCGESTRRWGHYVSSDLLSWKYKGVVLTADIPEDRDGVFSGSAVTFPDHIEFFYTGNVLEDGSFDYILEGRGANVIFASSSDGSKMSPKQILLRNTDYPDFCSCHVRDPKVSYENGLYKMVLGARSISDQGLVLLYEGPSVDKLEYKGSLSVPDMGYMWECPDMFELDGFRYLAVCPQGTERGECRFQNIFHSGYFTINGNTLSEFEEFDYGFDFYAPQTFVAPDGRRLLIGWMGIGDDSYSNPTVELGWQHCLTLPRELSVAPDGKLLQNPVRELNVLKGSCKEIAGEAWEGLPFEIDVEVQAEVRDDLAACVGVVGVAGVDGVAGVAGVAGVDGAGTDDYSDDFVLEISGARLSWSRENGTMILQFMNGEGYGRECRKMQIDSLSDVRVIADVSSLEIYINGGRYVMSTRFYPEYRQVRTYVKGASAKICPLRLKDTLVAIGEALIDFIPDKNGCEFHEVGAFSPAVGGAPANVCAAFSKLGGKARMLTKLGDDPFGNVITRTLDQAGVDTSYISRTAEANTALAFVSLAKDGGRVFSFYRNPSADMLFAPSEVTGDMLDDCYALHFCSVSLGDFPMKDAHRTAITIARHRGAIISFDPNLRFMLWDDLDELKRVVNEFIPDCDILKISDEELEFISGTSDIAEAIPAFFVGNVKLVIITKGKDGACALGSFGVIESSVPAVKAIDTTGAGDAFIGAFLWRLKKAGISREDLDSCSSSVISDCLDFANHYCSLSVQKHGAIPSYPEIEEL